ncbi:NUDIX hydrolase [Acidisoma cellulosilytica]|uniref:NUDIX hydrolase n=1 Tax=Acidisoma cellulosilyticum TaxID=2802395 RepID=A0A963Z5P1_9PROT|nr:NUDIX hydrolase [Acidisoma cellulosilyticum]MCB8883297.1 NUDIX hydrolase [Acidisoma cellulosilyticum]
MATSDLPEDMLCAALPYRLGRHGLEILLISSRETRGWGIPMEWATAERHPDRTAEIEAFRAAGVKGAISRKPIGDYPSSRRLAEGEERPCLVEVYPLLVSNEAATWPEKNQRRRIWFPGNEAAEKVAESGLALIIREWQETRVSSGRGTAKMARGRGGSRHG